VGSGCFLISGVYSSIVNCDLCGTGTESVERALARRSSVSEPLFSLARGSYIWALLGYFEPDFPTWI
jgi:hypothetical protein